MRSEARAERPAHAHRLFVSHAESVWMQLPPTCDPRHGVSATHAGIAEGSVAIPERTVWRAAAIAVDQNK